MEVKILGKTYSIKSAHNADFTKAVAQMVDQKIRDLTKKIGPVAPERLAVLTAMNLAGELIELQKTNGKSKQKIKNQIEVVISKIDHELERLETFS